MRTNFFWGLLLALALACVGTAHAGPLIFDRGLPVENLNNAAGANRSNVAWDFAGFGFFAGDDFTIAGSGSVVVDEIRLWAIADSGGAASANNNEDLGDDGAWFWGDTFKSMALYLDVSSSSTISSLVAANFLGAGSNETSDPNLSISRVQYPSTPAQDYQGTSGSFIQLFEIQLSNLGLELERGTSYRFGLECRGPNDTDSGTPGDFSDDVFSLCFPLAANKDLAGVVQEGADDLYSFLSAGAPSDPAVFGGVLDSEGFGWDKSSDLLIQIFAEVSEPGSVSLFLVGAGFLFLIAYSRRRKHGR